MESQPKKCEICKLSEKNDLDYGEMYEKDGCNIHYFCAFFSKDIHQNGELDDDGIWRFLIPDIRAGTNGYAKKRCYYCKKTYATVPCSYANCQRYYHVACGVKNKCLFEFYEEHKSFCHRHVEIKEKFAQHENGQKCFICDEPMGEYNPITSIPSCCNQGYYHKECIQKHALSAASVTKCPSCGNSDNAEDYRQFLRSRGIYCPIRDASWETSTAFQSLLVTYNECDARKCVCPQGRKHAEKTGVWEIIRCQYCGGSGVHVKCLTTPSQDGSYICEECIMVAVEVDAPEVDPTDDSESEQMDAKKDEQTNARTDDGPEKSKTMHRKCDPVAFQAQMDDKIQRLLSTKCNDLRQQRLKDFYKKSDFDARPPPPRWLI